MKHISDSVIRSNGGKSALCTNVRLWALLAPLAGAILTAGAAGAAEDADPATEGSRYLPWEKGSIKFGGFVTAFDSNLGFGVGAGAGVTINAEDLFGLESSLTVLRGEAMYRPGKSLRHQVDFSYAGYHRDGNATIDREIDLGDLTIPVGADVDSVFDFDIIRGTYSYALLQDERIRIALGVGCYVVPLSYGVDFKSSEGVGGVEMADTTLPLPAVALRGEFQLVPRLFLNASIDAMYLEISDFQGSLLDANVSVEYRPWKHFGIGVGYNGMAVNVEGESEDSDYPGVDFVGSVDVRFTGLMLYGKLSF